MKERQSKISKVKERENKKKWLPKRQKIRESERLSDRETERERERVTKREIERERAWICLQDSFTQIVNIYQKVGATVRCHCIQVQQILFQNKQKSFCQV